MFYKIHVTTKQKPIVDTQKKKRRNVSRPLQKIIKSQRTREERNSVSIKHPENNNNNNKKKH